MDIRKHGEATSLVKDNVVYSFWFVVYCSCHV
jgi:hypothetical protein